MPALTSQEANQLADNFLAMSKVIGEYRMKNFDNLSEAQKQNLKELHAKILDASDELYTMSATLVLENVQSSLDSIRNVTGQMKDTFAKLQNIQKAINISASVAALGAAILSKDSKAIGSSLRTLLDSVKA